MTVLVTGSEGFIGKNLCDALEERGVPILRWDKKNGNDIQDKEVPPYVKRIFHLACVPQMAATRNPALALKINAWETRRLALQAEERNIPMIYTSTLSVFGKALPDRGNITGETLFAPENEYEIGKLAGEHFLNTIHRNSKIYRLSNVYGPYQTPDENAECGVIGKLFHQALNGEPMTVIGDGRQSRDFSYVGDVVERLLVDFSDPYPKNLGTGVATPIIDVAHKIGMLCGGEYSIKSIGERPIDGIKGRRVADGNLPTKLDEGLKKTLEWFSSRI